MIEPGLRVPPADKKLAVTDKYIEALNLNAQIRLSAQAAQQNLYDMCMGFKKMRDGKLYKELGYENFGEYCETETGFKRTQVYSYISVIENLPADFVRTSEQIGMSKLYLISKLSDNDRAELTKNTDLENTSVRELEQKIKQLTSEKETAAAQISSLTQTADGLKNQISELEKEIEELESRPIEVAVADDSREVANLKDAMKRVDLEWGQRYGELEEQSIKDRREAEQEKQAALAKLRAELERTKAEYEKQLAEKTAEPDSKETFKAYLAAAIDSATRLCDFVHAHGDDVNFGFFCEKSKALSSMINKKLEEC